MTAQAREQLIYKNEKYGMADEPLEQYFSQLEERPEFESPDTACWRGYYGTWEIRDNRLFLIHFKGYTTSYKEVDMDFIFPNKKEVFADWVNGEIRVPHGEMLQYIHMGYESIYEILLDFEKGVLVSELLVYNEYKL